MGIGATDDGTFRVVADPSVDLTRYAVDGIVDFRAVGVTSEHVGMTLFSRRLDAQGQIVPQRNIGSAIAVSPDGKPMMEANPNAVTLNVIHEFQDAPANRTTAQCTYNTGNRESVMIGTGFHRKRGVLMRLTYKRGSSSTLGVGVNIEGNGWRAGGSAEKSSGDSFQLQWGTKKSQDEFHYTQYEYKLTSCGWIPVGSGGYWRSQSYRPDSHIGGNRSGRPRWYPITPMRNCVSHYPGGQGPEMVKTRTRAATYKGGVDTGFVNLSSRSGFSEETAVYADVRIPRMICGWLDDPGGTPGLFVIGKPT